jgi:hypothetical protein|tara:strand:+ start:348 stop:569 length:222 start_codon:yes stop_codon:yes gene_type:complete
MLLPDEYCNHLHALHVSNTARFYFAILDLLESGKSPESIAHIVPKLFEAPEDLEKFGGWYFPHLVEAVRDLNG